MTMTGIAPSFLWSVEAVRRLSTLWLEGRTATQIAMTLGGGLSRNAVMGKLHRLGLSGSRTGFKTYAKGATAKPVFVMAEDVQPRSRREAKPSISTRADPLPVAVAPIPAFGGPVPFNEVDRDQCRFSIDLRGPATADMLVCGAPVVPGKSWCPICAARVSSRVAVS